MDYEGRRLDMMKPIYKAVPRHKVKFMRGMGWKVFEDNPNDPGLIMVKSF